MHVHMACALLDVCGKMLYNHRDTQQRCDAMLTLLSKLRSVHRLPCELLTLTVTIAQPPWPRFCPDNRIGIAPTQVRARHSHRQCDL